MKRIEAKSGEKAEKAAALDKSIEKELLEHLKGAVSGDPCNVPVDDLMKILDGGEQNATAEDKFEEEPEIESIEGYNELEEEDDIEDFSNFAIEDALVNDVEPDPFDCKRVKREPESANVKLEKDARWLNKAKVLVEVEHEDAHEIEKAIFECTVACLLGFMWQHDGVYGDLQFYLLLEQDRFCAFPLCHEALISCIAIMNLIISRPSD